MVYMAASGLTRTSKKRMDIVGCCSSHSADSEQFPALAVSVIAPCDCHPFAHP